MATHQSANPPAAKSVRGHHHHRTSIPRFVHLRQDHHLHQMQPTMPCKHSLPDSHPNYFLRAA